MTSVAVDLEGNREPSKDLLLGRRNLELVTGIEVLEDFERDPILPQWMLKVRITVESENTALIAKNTDWYVCISDDYPWGRIDYHPAKENSLTLTFPHQVHNSALSKDIIPYRNGNLCLRDFDYGLGRVHNTREPFSAAHRLAWLGERAKEWLVRASSEKLIVDGEPFELPMMPFLTDQSLHIFNEGPESFEKWTSSENKFGLAQVKVLKYTTKQPTVVTSFRSLNGDEIVSTTWGEYVAGSLANSPKNAVWIRTEKAPVIEPWGTIETWGQLKTFLESQDISWDHDFKSLCSKIRNGKANILFLGFPIPEKWGCAGTEMHWFCLEIPKLSQTIPIIRKKGQQESPWDKDKKNVFLERMPIKWFITENWSPRYLRSRIKSKETKELPGALFIGAGALGASLVKPLARTGLTKVKIIDGDKLAVGNVCRHELGLRSLGRFKAECVASDLVDLSTEITVDYENEYLKETNSKDILGGTDFEFVVDSTADDQILCTLSGISFESEKAFFICFVGMRAKNSYCYFSKTKRFDHDLFRNRLSERLKAEVEEIGNSEEIREHRGCWHPIFPATDVDMKLSSSLIASEILRLLTKPQIRDHLTVFEKTIGDSGLEEIKVVRREF